MKPEIGNLKKRRRLKYVCHRCGKRGSKWADQIIEQAFTGRRYCSFMCFELHLRDEGFSRAAAIRIMAGLRRRLEANDEKVRKERGGVGEI